MTEFRKWMEAVETKITDKWFREDSFKVYKKANPVAYELADSPGTIDTLEGPVKYQKGYYLMTGPKGEKYPISPERFSELYSNAKDGMATPKKIVKLAKIADHSGTVDTSWGEKLQYNPDVDVIVRHGPGDYGVVKRDIFKLTYEEV